MYERTKSSVSLSRLSNDDFSALCFTLAMGGSLQASPVNLQYVLWTIYMTAGYAIRPAKQGY